MVEDTSIICNSVCKECGHRICRLIIPPDYYWEEMGEDLEDDNDREEQVIEHNYCKALEMPIDHIVLDCNKFYPKEQESLIKNTAMFKF